MRAELVVVPSEREGSLLLVKQLALCATGTVAILYLAVYLKSKGKQNCQRNAERRVI